MSSSQRIMNIITKVATSKTFENFSSFYLKYIKVAGGIGAGVGTVIAIGHLLDCNKAHKKEVRKAIAKGKDPDDIEEISYLYGLSILTTGPLVGASVGVMWPVFVTLGPLYYAFGPYLGPIVQSLLALSLTIDNSDFDDSSKKKKFNDDKSL